MACYNEIGFVCPALLILHNSPCPVYNSTGKSGELMKSRILRMTCYVICFAVICSSIALCASAAHWSDKTSGFGDDPKLWGNDWRTWKQSDALKDSSTMAKYGSWVVSMARMLVESGVVPDDRTKFNPGIFLKWEYENGYINKGFYQQSKLRESTGYAPVYYAWSNYSANLTVSSVKKRLSEKDLLKLLKTNYLIVQVQSGHYTYVAREESLRDNTIYYRDSAANPPKEYTDALKNLTTYSGNYKGTNTKPMGAYSVKQVWAYPVNYGLKYWEEKPKLLFAKGDTIIYREPNEKSGQIRTEKAGIPIVIKATGTDSKGVIWHCVANTNNLGYTSWVQDTSLLSKGIDNAVDVTNNFDGKTISFRSAENDYYVTAWTNASRLAPPLYVTNQNNVSKRGDAPGAREKFKAHASYGEDGGTRISLQSQVNQLYVSVRGKEPLGAAAKKAAHNENYMIFKDGSGYYIYSLSAMGWWWNNVIVTTPISFSRIHDPVVINTGKVNPRCKFNIEIHGE